jgi:hypothetical protein
LAYGETVGRSTPNTIASEIARHDLGQTGFVREFMVLSSINGSQSMNEFCLCFLSTLTLSDNPAEGNFLLFEFSFA